MINLALVGFGGYGNFLASVIEQASARLGCRLVAAADARSEDIADKARVLRKRGVEIFSDALAMFESIRGRCQGVYIATGISSHAFLTTAAMRAGLHVHLEKPPAAVLQDVDSMLDVQKSTGKMCMVGFQSLHASDLQLIKRHIVEGKLGAVERITCHALWPRDASYYGRNDWAGKLRSGASWVLDGPATNALAHQVMNTLYLASPREGSIAAPTCVRAELYAAGDVESHDTAAIEIRTAEGPTIYLLLSHRTQETAGPVIEVHAQNGHVAWDLTKGGRITLPDGHSTPFSTDEGANEKMVENFVAAIAANDAKMLRCPLEMTRGVVMALDAAHESSGRIHRIDGQFCRQIDAGTPRARTVVEGLDDAILQCARQGALFSDLPSRPAWAQATSPFATEGYSQFGRVFKAW